MTAPPDRAVLAGSPDHATSKNWVLQLVDFLYERLGGGSGSASATEKAVTRATLEAGRELQPIAASVAANALSLTLNPTSLDFRSATLSNGAVATRTVSASISLVVPSGATLGTTNGALARLYVLAIDNAGTVELAVANAAGGTVLDQGGVISTTVMNTASDLAGTVYSQSARTNVPYRVVGYVELTQAAAGTWATAPSLVQGMGPGVLSALATLGFGQTPVDVSASRALNTTYTNATGKARMVAVAAQGSAGVSCMVRGRVNGVSWAFATTTESHSGTYQATPQTIYLPVPPGGTYRVEDVAGTNIVYQWVEL